MSGVNVHFGSIMNVWSKCTLWEYNELSGVNVTLGV